MESCTVNLIFSKPRLAPIKKISIPRLELLDVIIGLRRLTFVEQQLKISVQRKIVWTDSQCVIYWIASNKQMSTFVENRLKEITDIDFRYGLLFSCDEWPTWSYDMTVKDNDVLKSELKTSSVNGQTELLVGEPLEENNILEKFDNRVEPLFGLKCENFSNMTRLVRVTAWTLRFIKKLKKENISGPLTVKEIEDAKLKWIVLIQRKHFAKEIQSISDNRMNNIIRQLGLVLDNKGLIRCVDRINHAQVSEDTKRPIFIPKTDTFTCLLIESYHRRLLHVGVAQALSQIRQKYWIPQERSTVRKDLKECRNCIRYEGGPYKMPLIPPFPKNRISESAPFTYTGINYFGPFYIKSPTGSEKVWVCLYTCLVIRAIHLELMLDMTTEQYLLGFRRFVAQCGTPKQILSDNALRFKSASNFIKNVWCEVISDYDVLNYVEDKGVEWKFIVELAPMDGRILRETYWVSKTIFTKGNRESMSNCGTIKNIINRS